MIKRKCKKTLSAIAAIVMTLMMAVSALPATAFADTVEAADPATEADTVTITVTGTGDDTTFKPVVNQLYHLTAEITSEQGKPYHIHWSTDRPAQSNFYVNGVDVGDPYTGGNSVDFEVTKASRVIALRVEAHEGAVHDTTCDGTYYKAISIPVVGVEPETTISLDKTEATLKVGGQTTLTATVNPSTKAVTWKSDDVEVATVDQSGVVTAVAAGETTITATTEDGKAATCKVVVEGSAKAPEQDSDGFYLIKTPEDLQWVANQVNNAENAEDARIDVRLANDIDASTVTLPIGTRTNSDEHPYSGTFDGNGKTVTVNISSSSGYIGLIGYGDGVTVKDLTVKGSVRGSSFVGGIVGGDRNYESSITGCVNEATISSSGSSIGGIAGAFYGTINDCKNSGDVSGSQDIGGIVGEGSAVSGCSNTGNITASFYYAGGIAGSSGNMETLRQLTRCSNTGTVTAVDYAGGLIGRMRSGDTAAVGETAVVENCYNTGDVIATTGANGVGGLVGNFSSASIDISNSYNTGALSDASRGTATGTLIGKAGSADSVINITNSYYIQSGSGDVKTVGNPGTATVNDKSSPITAEELAKIIDENGFLIASPQEETTISLDETALNMNAGEEKQLTATVSPEGTAVTWSSDDEAVATVDQNGKVTAVEVGTANITAAANGKTATCAVTVEEKEVTDIELDNTALNLKAGASGKLTAKVTPDDATDKTVTWSSNNEDVATVDQNGNIAAVTAGTAKITATAGEQTATCDVTVYEVDLQPLPEPGEVAEGETVAAGMSEEAANAARDTLNSIVEQIIDDSIPEGVSGAVEEIKSAIGAGAVVTLEVRSQVLTETPQDDIAAKIDEAVTKLSESNGAAFKIQGYVDLGIDVYTQTAATEKLKVGELTSIDKPITFTIAVPDDIKEIATKYYIIRTHEKADGSIETSVIEPEVNENGTLTFSTDRFSTYAIAYTTEDVAQSGSGNNGWTDIDDITGGNGDNDSEGNGNGIETVGSTGTSTGNSVGSSNALNSTAKTGDEMNLALYAMIMMMAAVGISGALIYRRNSR